MGFMEVSIKCPEKLSVLARMAMEDLEVIENDPRYVVEMSESWHERTLDGKCEVCLAGAVMANRLKLPLREYYNPYQFNDAWRSAFYALDLLRIGDVEKAIKQFQQSLDYTPSGRDYAHPSYEDEPMKWKIAMNKTIEQLEERGL